MAVGEMLKAVEAVGAPKAVNSVEKRRRALMDAAKKYGMPLDEVVSRMSVRYDVKSADDLTDAQCADLIVEMADSARMGK